jgi:4-hydroxy-3-methylbut-2-en-1-yl diphosphate synthase IspG/GcpE
MKFNVKIKLEQRKDTNGTPDANGKLPLLGIRVPIFADIRYSGTRIYYFIGYRIDAVNFDPTLQMVKKNSFGFEGKKKVQYTEINNRIKKIKAELELFFAQRTNIEDKSLISSLLDNSCKKAEKSDKMEDVENYETGFFNQFQKYIDVINISEGRKNILRP